MGGTETALHETRVIVQYHAVLEVDSRLLTGLGDVKEFITGKSGVNDDTNVRVDFGEDGIDDTKKCGRGPFEIWRGFIEMQKVDLVCVSRFARTLATSYVW
jgi:hypothetical protein